MANAVTDCLLGKSRDLMVAGVARLRACHGQFPNSGESGYQQPPRRCVMGVRLVVTSERAWGG